MAWDRKMTAVPSVGVAMSVYNQASIVGDAIESLLCQTQPPEQIVIVDDGSTDGSPEVIAGYEKFGVQLVGLERRGVSEVLNRGASLLETDYVAIQAADDRSLPDRLEVELDAAEQTGSALVTALPRIIDMAGKVIPDDVAPEFFVHRDDELHILRRLFETGNLLCASSALIRRDAFDQVGGFHPRLLHLQDHWLWTRLAGIASVTRLDDRLVEYRRNPDGGNLSSPANDHRMRVELGFCYRHFFDLVADDIFLEAFGDLISGCNGTIDRDLEEALLFLGHTDPLVQQCGADRLLMLTLDEDRRGSLDQRGLGPFAFFDAIGSVDVDRLLERDSVQAAHDAAVAQRDSVQAAHDAAVAQRDSVQAAHDALTGSLTFRLTSLFRRLIGRN
jgi:glycosyltransferase involved in cell wall biosynthesis